MYGSQSLAFESLYTFEFFHSYFFVFVFFFLFSLNRSFGHHLESLTDFFPFEINKIDEFWFIHLTKKELNSTNSYSTLMDERKLLTNCFKMNIHDWEELDAMLTKLCFLLYIPFSHFSWWKNGQNVYAPRITRISMQNSGKKNYCAYQLCMKKVV